MTKHSNLLAVTSKTIETVYRDYLDGAYAVNRRYQRKLVWSVTEKERLIDSIVNQYPLPQFLVAEGSTESKYRYEIIDGMQRLNAIIAFIENEFSLNGEYFDLQSLAMTKKKFDEGDLVQHTPVMGRQQSVNIATYEIAQSVYRTTDQPSIEEVFRRINSSGQKLSQQDLRQAGSTSAIADLVRDLSSRMRGDHSPSDIVPLSGMKALSISSTNNEYGISPDDMFWVQQGILRRSEVRASGDEQLILDIVADMIFDPMLSTGTPVRNDLFQTEVSSTPEETARRISTELSNPAWLSGRAQLVMEQFQVTFDRVRMIIDKLPAGTNFKKHIGTRGNNPVPRYFEALFAAVFQLLNKHGKDLNNTSLAIDLLRNAQPFESMPGGGGEWQASKKQATVDALVTLLSHAFDKPFITEGPITPTDTMSGAEFDSIITGALIETTGRDMKQGFLDLSVQRRFDGDSFNKIVKTLTAISNTHPLEGGYILVGVADTESDVARIEEIDSIRTVKYRSLNIVGLDREFKITSERIDEYWSRIIKKVAQHSKVDPEYARQAASRSRVAVHTGRTIFVLCAPPVDSPVTFDGKYYSRVGSDTQESLNPVKFGMDFNMRLHHYGSPTRSVFSSLST